MSAERLFRYRFKCTTENAFKYVWRSEDEGLPTKCPDNSTDTIDTTSITAIEIRDSDLVTLKEEQVQTGGHFKVDNVVLNIESGSPESTEILDVSWPLNISVLNLHVSVKSENIGDYLTMITSPETLAGVVSGVIGSPPNRVPASQTVIDNAVIGYNLILDNGVDKEDLGRILTIDTENGEIYTEHTPMNDFAPGTFIRMHRVGISELFLDRVDTKILGQNKVGATYLPAGTVVRLIYKNMDGMEKNLSIIVEHMF